MRKTRAISSVGILLAVLFGIQSPPARSDKEPEITLKSSKKNLTLRRGELLKRSDVTTIEISDDPLAPGKKIQYTAVPVYALLEGLSIPENSTIHYVCSDGFAASIPNSQLKNKSPAKAIAYLAIEKSTDRWPVVEPGKTETPGPFYIVWKNAKASGITRESWPYHVVGFEIRQSMQDLYPNIFPEAKLAETHPVKRGFEVFKRNCFACHTLNLQGDGRMGPDLNVPYSPTEYFQPFALKTLIRNPQSLRHFTEGKMHPFPKEIIPDSELSDLVLYLKHMSKRKVKSP
ncbi:MAG: cytochrome c [Bdellovibrio sp.]|nr:cytochrome c [Bdellovibrio sp.]